MADTTATINVRHRIGLLAKATLFAAEHLQRVNVRLPMALIVWAIEHSSYISLNHGPWQRVRLGLTVEDCQ